MRILLAEDDDVSRHILKQTLLRWGYDVVCAVDGEEAWGLLQQPDAPRIAILDWIMPRMDGIEVCRNVREHLKERYVYVLLLTAKDHKDDIISGMGAGADDYISKPFDPQELRMRLSAGRRIIDLQTQLLAAQESLRYLATHDSLTGLVNRAEILERLRRELDRADREGVSVGLLVVDVDHFKLVNDTFGHAVGDLVLVEVAARMRAALRSYDEIGRYGGEEFLVVLPGCDNASACRQAERLRELVASQPIAVAGGSVRATVSIGISARDRGCTDDLALLVREADECLYHAKSAGRNRIAQLGSGCPKELPKSGDEPPRLPLPAPQNRLL